jgi:hypothetical protein
MALAWTNYNCVESKKPQVRKPGVHHIGAGEEIRTLDIHLGKVALYQLSYSRTELNCKSFVEILQLEL